MISFTVPHFHITKSNWQYLYVLCCWQPHIFHGSSRPSPPLPVQVLIKLRLGPWHKSTSESSCLRKHSTGEGIYSFNAVRPEQNGCPFTEAIFKMLIFWLKLHWTLFLKSTNCWNCYKPELMMVQLLQDVEPWRIRYEIVPVMVRMLFQYQATIC